MIIKNRNFIIFRLGVFEWYLERLRDVSFGFNLLINNHYHYYSFTLGLAWFRIGMDIFLEETLNSEYSTK